MAEKVKQTGIIIAIIAGITLPTLAIAWTGGGRLARVEVVAEEAKETGDLHTEEIKSLTGTIHTIQLNHKDTQALAAKSVEYMAKIEGKLTAIESRLTEQSTIQTVNSVKLATLIKDAGKDDE
jgi:peptidoglycan hydrolase CwlO-like protein